MTKEIDEFESLIKQAIEVPNQTTFRNIEEKQLTLRQEILQVNNSGKNFLEDARKVSFSKFYPFITNFSRNSKGS